MKVFIWIAFAILHSIICAIIKDTGFILGGLPSAILVGVVFLWPATTLCKKWDWYQAMKKANEAGMTMLEYGKHGLPEKVLLKLESYRDKPVDELKSQLKACVKAKKITKEQYTILLKEYSKK